MYQPSLPNRVINRPKDYQQLSVPLLISSFQKWLKAGICMYRKAEAKTRIWYTKAVTWMNCKNWRWIFLLWKNERAPVFYNGDRGIMMVVVMMIMMGMGMVFYFTMLSWFCPFLDLDQPLPPIEVKDLHSTQILLKYAFTCPSFLQHLPQQECASICMTASLFFSSPPIIYPLWADRTHSFCLLPCL